MKNTFLQLLFLIFIIISIIYNKKQVIDAKNYDYNVQIYRDVWGVPHIFGEKDEDVAYGLAYAHAEDDFETIQNILIATRGQLASIIGQDGAPNDYLINLLKVWDTVDSKYNSDVSPKIQTICNAYADGINRFIEKNPDRMLGNLYPTKGKDKIAGFVYRTTLMYELDWYIKKILQDKEPDFSSDFNKNNSNYPMYGSNVFAISPTRSSDGHTRIAINSHQPWSGPVTWYEAHLHSKEGLNITGGLFPGSPVIFKGHNKNIAWSHTVNDPDLVDIYKLTINPENDMQYLLDGKWKNFVISIAPIKVKLFGPIKWTFKRDILWSDHGPVLKTNHGTYAIRFSGYNLVGQMEQWYRMNKANDLADFKAAMQMMQIPMFNTLYADKLGNLFYIYNGLIPKRLNGYDWDKILPGDIPDLIWEEYYEFTALPKVTNPESGFLQNCNSTPYLTSLNKDNPKKILPDNTGIEEFQTNRALRAIELFGIDSSITKNEFYDYKYDTYYSKESVMNYARNSFLKNVNTNDSLLLKGAQILKEWDLGNQKENRNAAIAHLTFKIKYAMEKYIYNHEDVMKRFKKGVEFLMNEFGRIDIELGDLQRLHRGNVDLPLDGAPDVLRAIYSSMKDGRKVARNGDCFFQMVDWDKDGNLYSESIHQFGTATLDSNSMHFSDQSILFSNKEMKPVWMELDSIKNNLVRSYRP